jgi:hypothetical protein
MQAFCERAVEELRDPKPPRFIFKSKSPCPPFSATPHLPDGNHTSHRTSGLFARAFTRAFPSLPCEEEGRLHDPLLRENFIERVFALKRFRDGGRGRAHRQALQTFHACAKYLLMAHSPEAVQELGAPSRLRLPGQPAGDPGSHETRFLAALAECATSPARERAPAHAGVFY